MKAAILAVLFTSSLYAADAELAATAANSLGIELYRSLAGENPNLCISPSSIEIALAMTSVGAKGETLKQMRKVLHLPKSKSDGSFRSLLDVISKLDGKSITVLSANRLFGQTGFEFRESYLKLVKKEYGAPLEPLDFKKDPAQATQTINKWVEGQTRDRIRDLIPSPLDGDTALVLVNALYLKADWFSAFEKSLTKPEPFHAGGGAETVEVPTMHHSAQLGYSQMKGFSAVAIPYVNADLQFLALIPDEINGIQYVENQLTPKLLRECAQLNSTQVNLSLPKFKMESAALELSKPLTALGMPAAFDQPRGSADFDGIAARKPNDYLYISKVYHKTFIEVDENGTEAAAATAVAVVRLASAVEPKVIDVKIDRPFLFAIQERSTGVCLFLGKVSDPR